MKSVDQEVEAILSAGVEQHVGAQAIAAVFAVSADTILAEMDRGALGYARIGSRRVVPISLVKAYIAEHAIGKHPARIPAPTGEISARQVRALKK